MIDRRHPTNGGAVADEGESHEEGRKRACAGIGRRIFWTEAIKFLKNGITCLRCTGTNLNGRVSVGIGLLRLGETSNKGPSLSPP